jgi:hypothetical protein
MVYTETAYAKQYGNYTRFVSGITAKCAQEDKRKDGNKQNVYVALKRDRVVKVAFKQKRSSIKFCEQMKPWTFEQRSNDKLVVPNQTVISPNICLN